ncbi:MAG: hypothetical protein AAGF07_03560 [Patescibacteria group bacterium]
MLGCKKIVVILCSVCVLAFNSSIPASTQDLSRGLVLYPSIESIDLDKGKTYSYPITLENATEENVDVLVSFETFLASSNEGQPQITPFEEGSQERSWISSNTERLSLESQASKTVDIDLNIPLEADPGGYYYAITFTKQVEQTELTQVLITQRLVSLLFLNITGDTKRDVRFAGFETDQYVYDPFFDFLTLKSGVNLAGRSYYKPTGVIWLYRGSDTPFDSIPLNPKNKIILPNSTRFFEVVDKPRFAQSWLSNEVETSSETVENSSLDRPWFGVVTLEANANYINAQGELSIVNTETEILFIPWKMGLLVLLVLGVVCTSFYLLKLKLKSKKSESK